MYAILGTTGHTGAVVADSLLTQGQPVRVVARDAAKVARWRDRGAEVAVADLDDVDALTRAFTGVAGAYVLVPPRPTSATPLEDNQAVVATLAKAIAAAKVPHVALLSSVGAHHPDGTGPIRSVHHAERVLGEVAAVTAVRASYFLENWGASLGMLDQGVLPTFVAPDVAFPMVATADIGRTAADALVAGGHGRAVIELAGPREYSPDDIAAELTKLTGKPVAAQRAPLDAVVPTFTSFGLSAAVAALYREMYEGIESGRVAWEGGAARARRGTDTAADVLRRLLAK